MLRKMKGVTSRWRFDDCTGNDAEVEQTFQATSACGNSKFKRVTARLSRNLSGAVQVPLKNVGWKSIAFWWRSQGRYITQGELPEAVVTSSVVITIARCWMHIIALCTEGVLAMLNVRVIPLPRY